VPISTAVESVEAVDLACRLAAERHATVALIATIEVPADLPLDSHMPDEEEAARHALDEAQAIADSYGIASSAHVVRGRDAGEVTVQEARRARIELIVVGAARRQTRNPHTPIFGPTVQFVLKHASCRVMVAAPRTTTPPSRSSGLSAAGTARSRG
jgi:nucleotide-binding universal stress UspA family protein